MYKVGSILKSLYPKFLESKIRTLVRTFERKTVLFLLIFLFPTLSLATPQGGVVTGGSATISTPTPSVMQINQTSPKAIINWQSFNIGANEKVHFQQPNSSSIALNRVNPRNGVSKIFGSLTATGQVWLINPAGIWFGPGSHVNVSGLVASTLDIKDQDFMKGNYKFVQQKGWNGSVINEGRIVINNAGLGAFMGAGVVNTGHIQADLGTVILASGKETTISFTRDGLVSFTVDKEVTDAAYDQHGRKLRDGVRNKGKISARGGRILMTAKNASKVLDNAINMDGIAQAKSVGMKNGEIVFGGHEGTVKIAGKVNVSGYGKGQRAGKVRVLGKKVIIAKKARIKASGHRGGGEVLIGGSYRGQNKKIQNAKRTFIDKFAAIDADAYVNGDGGSVIVWSDELTKFSGNISAKGGAEQGNGGFVETSSKGQLDIEGGTVDTRAPMGATGTWLLDPTNIWIAATLENAQAAGMSGANVSANTHSNSTFAASGPISDSLLTTNNLQAALINSNIIVTTTNTEGTGQGNITVVDPFAWSSTNSLTLNAENNIAINGAITTGASGAQLILNAGGAVTQTALINGSGGLTHQGTGTVNLTQTNTYAGPTIVNGAMILSNASGALSNTSGIQINQGGSLTLDNNALNNNNRINNSSAITMNGGEFIVKGNASANTTETLGALQLATGHSTITMTPDVAKNTQITFASLSRTTGATALFRGVNLGANTVASQTANSSNIIFTSAPTLTGGGGNAGTTTVSILAGAIGAGGLSGHTSSGTDFVTYNPPTGSYNGVRPLFTSEYASAPATNVNLKLTANRSANDTASINSLLLTGDVTYDFDTSGGPNTITLGSNTLSGNILSIGSANVINPGDNSTVAFGSAEAKIFPIANLTFGNNAAITGTGGLTTSGAGDLLQNRSVAISGGVTINNGTLKSGVANPFSTAQAFVIRAPGTLNLNNNNLSITTLALESGSTLGSTITTGTGTLTLSGQVTHILNGTGATGASMLGKLALGTSDRIFSISDGLATNDVAISALISGRGGVTKTGAGQLTLSGANSYLGSTTINAGTLSIGADNNLGSLPLIPVINKIILNGGTLETTANFTVNANRGMTLNSNGGTISTSPSTTLTYNGIMTGSGLFNKAGTGILNLGGINLYSGATNINAGKLSLTNANALGNSSATTVANDAVLDLNFNSLSLINANTITLNGTGINNSGSLTLSGSNIIMNNPIVLGSSAKISGTGSGTMVFSGNITGSDYLTISFSNAGISLPAITLSNSAQLDVTTNGSIIQTGALTIPGAASFSAGSNSILLSNVANNFSGPVSFTNSGLNSVLFANNNDLQIGTTTVGQNLSLTSAGDITQSGAITVGGSTTLISTAINSDIALADFANNFGTGSITLGNISTFSNLRDVALRNTNVSSSLPSFSNLSNLRNLTLVFDQAAITLPVLTLTNGGNLNITAGGAITQSGILNIAGTANFNSGANAITLMQNNAFAGAVTLNNSGSNDATIKNTVDLTLGASTVGRKLTATTTGSIILDGSLIAGGTGDAIVLSGSRFNNSGNHALTTSNGRFLVFSSNTNPFSGATPDIRGNLGFNFKEYNKTYASYEGGSAPLGSGNGFLYSFAPTIAPTLINSVSKNYDSTNTAMLSASNYNATTGAVDGDAVILNNPTNGNYDNKNVGTNKNVSVSGITIASAANGSATVYGYQTLSTANANIGIITPASLTIAGVVANDKVYDGNRYASISGNPIINGVIGGDNVNLDSNHISALFANKDVGMNKSVSFSGFTLYGSDALNYRLNNPQTVFADIMPKPLTITDLHAENKIYNANSNALLNLNNARLIGVLTGDSVQFNTQSMVASFNDKNVGINKLIRVSGLVLSGADAKNYLLEQPNLEASIIAKNIEVTGLGVNNKQFNGSTEAFLNFNDVSLLGIFAGDNVLLNSSQYHANFVSANPGTNIPVEVSGLSLTGFDSKNYLLTQPTNLVGNIVATQSPPINPIINRTINRTNNNDKIASIVNVTFNNMNSEQNDSQVISLDAQNLGILLKNSLQDKPIDFNRKVNGGCVSVNEFIKICD